METNLEKQESAPLEIHVFTDAKKIQDGEFFIAKKDSVEGHDRATLTRIQIMNVPEVRQALMDTANLIAEGEFSAAINSILVLNAGLKDMERI